jgi:valyl-tRNA synthetase
VNLELGKTYDPKSAEERWFQRWIDLGYFKADPRRSGEKFSIVIPPPNVTGQLHLGHALNTTLHDIIVRTRRMQGFNTLWLPGTDHAGIATQNAVEKTIAKDGLDRHQMGREAFVDRVWQWRDEKGSRILEQLRRLGASCDWSRERFTLDAGLSRAVNTVFVDLHKRGLIYRDRRLINWCPRCETALSDLEVDHRETKSYLWYIRYPFSDRSGSITVATTRPETMLGDTAVAVNPSDARYTPFVGRMLSLPLTNREIKIVSDATVDAQFGTGAVKITPGHDLNDFALGRRHNLEQISVMDARARMNENAGVYQGLDRDAARVRIVADLEAQGLIEKIEPHTHSVGVCSRCDTVVEPMLSEQWFVRVRGMARRAIEAVKKGDTTFFPKFWENTFFNWMENAYDWCISRQLWWGHRIPAYRCQRCDHFTVAAERPPKCEECGGTDLVQDEDVLDTWFSSGLWPFSTLGWPDDTPDLARYYPTSLLITGFDIIFFWVARMMMLGLEMTDKVPFEHVYITPLVRDEYGKKMTKSKGNVVDPLELMDQYGTDAVRLTLAQLAAQGRDVILSHDRFAASRAFANKIWNAARFVMMNLESAPQPLVEPSRDKLELADRWILERLDQAVVEVTGTIDAYEFNVAAMAIYDFIWHRFCDWYIELAKDPLKTGGERQAVTRWVLVKCFDTMLRLLHPFMPFISEEIWQVMRPYLDEAGLSAHLAIAKFPVPASAAWISPEDDAAMRRCFETTQTINSLRALLGYHPGQRVNVILRPLKLTGSRNTDDMFTDDGALNPAKPASVPMTDEEQAAFAAEFENWRGYAATLAKCMEIKLLSNRERAPRGFVTTILEWAEISLEAPAGFDFARAREKIRKHLAEVSNHVAQHAKRLNDEGFRAKADQETKDQMAEKFESLRAQQRQLDAQLTLLSEGHA